MTALQPYLGVQFVNEDGDIAVDGEIRVAFLTPVTGVSVTLHDPEGADIPLSVTSIEKGEGYVVVPLKPLAPATTYQLTVKGATDKSGNVMEDHTAPFRTAP
ncbi:Ig-like domain-containing protein [Nonomuraea sp. JJY05]|uniref:Ig-like domain-containing protein n=1 Tax=Nonomuraea sp. JJY05 TaxID=3350255 RepID=UPI00373E8556